MSAFHTFFHRFERFLPFLIWWPMVNRQTLQDDFIAGLTGAIIVLPQGVAFASIAGMPPEYGLYAGMVPAIVAALFGSSWHLVSGPTTAASIVLFSVLSSHAQPGSAEYVQLAITLTFMVGLIQLALGLAKLGKLVNFISHSVVLGFTAGAAILIATNQAKSFFGIAIPRGTSFFSTWEAVLLHLDKIDPYVNVVAVTTLTLGILIRRFFPKLPYMILAMLGGSLLGVFFQKSGHSIATVGALPSQLPPLSSPSFTLESIKQLVTGAVAVTLLTLTEALSIARAMAVRSGQDLNGNQEFIGQGLSNLIGAFFSGYAATGSFNRSGLNYSAGAKTPLAAIFSGVLLAIIVVLVAPLTAYLPNAAMAGILFLVAWNLIDFHHIHQITKASLAETAILLITFAATLVLDLEEAIVLGVMLSLIVYLSHTSKPEVIARVPDPNNPKRKFVRASPYLPECPQMKIIRIDGSLYFGAVNSILEIFRSIEREYPAQKHLMVVASPINFVDVAGAEFLATEARRKKERGGGLYFIQLKQAVLSTLRKGNYIEMIGEENLFRSKGYAIVSVFNKLDPEICKNCQLRVYTECGQVPGHAVLPQPSTNAVH